MNTFLYIVAAIVLLIVVLAIIAPKSYEVNRSIGISKALPEVFSYLKYVKNQANWSPWEVKDPNMEKIFTGTDGEAGFVLSWSGNKDVGAGEQEIKKIVNNEVVETELRFLKPFKSTSDAYIKVQEDGEGTKVTWGFSGKNKFPVSIMMLFMNMDKQVGKDFEEGLNKLKEVLED